VWNRQRSGRRPSNPETTKLGVKKSTKNGEAFMVERTINALACALIAPLAFAQTSTTTTEQKTTTQRTTMTEPASGTVTTTYEPGKIIVVGSESGHDTFSYVLDKTVRYVNRAGREIDEHLIKPGTRIHVYYDGTGETRVVNRVVVDED
jgi:hypothetical protein